MHYLKGYYLLAVLFLFNTIVFGQKSSTNPWLSIEEDKIELRKSNAKRVIIPNKYKTFTADLKQLETILAEAPLRFTEAARQKEVIIDVPMPNETFASFVIVKAPVMHPDLAAKYPGIETYAGYKTDDPTTQIRLDLTPHGFHAMVRSPQHSAVFIEPYAQFHTKDYISYYKKDNPQTMPFTCHVDSVNETKPKTKAEMENLQKMIPVGDCTLRTYRIAVSGTGEYTTFHGGTKALALAAMVTTMNRVNEVFENDISVTMVLVANNDEIIYTDAANDPFTNNSSGALINENQTVCDDVIGAANYDIGHNFSTGGGGLAQLRSPCGGSKARGVTGQSAPIGDPFDIDYVAHEIGHQFGGNHTQNNTCNQSNASVEPGSASTIMGYAGICAPDVQSNSDAYFHGFSIAEMADFITNGNGNSCDVPTVTGNTTPTADAGGNYTIPSQTPFVLTGAGTDPEGNASLTYCWEQYDAEDPDGSSIPLATSTSGPAFRSFFATTSPARYFPRLADIISNTDDDWEELATVSRDYNFTLTVRDNNPGSGCVAQDEMLVTVDGNSGPFLVNQPNGGETHCASSGLLVTWDVAGSDAAPVNATSVDILLSTDGGLTYATTLATAVPNTGAYTATIPTIATTTARIMVRGSNNIFFDISNGNFTIEDCGPNFSLAVTPSETEACQGDDALYTVNIISGGGFNGAVSLTATGLPTGATLSFSSTTITPSMTSDMTITNTSGVAAGVYPITITGVGAPSTQTIDINLIVIETNLAQVSLTNPLDAATDIGSAPVFDWDIVAGANTYDFEMATDASFTNIVESMTGLAMNNYTTAITFDISTTYYWRVRANNDCVMGTYSDVWSFTTATIICTETMSTDDPITISETQGGTITSTINIPTSGTIDDVIISNLDISHIYTGDLIVRIEHAGTTVLLLDNPGIPASNFGCSEDNILATFDDTATSNAEDECSNSGTAIAGTFLPMEALSAFDGMDMQGDWIVSVEDTYPQADGGSLNSWRLDICTIESVACTPNINLTGSVATGIYQASMTVTSDGTVNTGAVTYDAGDCILLDAGFEVVVGNEFDAIIGGCQ